ncbi:hypothetical protein PF008_g32826 [Phytophthora fragariae]|uniref:Uncharacterized protein n=1 Tax=Phytophthora fragariae TaxID=53985 RepID=A0A6A3D7A2_9STRA|nr:hypothetical protein PF009_g32386 [Phytophthora fragariae]KAE9261522.1 hypothetical protein PF008_g32826 [Phytophthora fragariae]
MNTLAISVVLSVVFVAMNFALFVSRSTITIMALLSLALTGSDTTKSMETSVHLPLGTSNG